MSASAQKPVSHLQIPRFAGHTGCEKARFRAESLGRIQEKAIRADRRRAATIHESARNRTLASAEQIPQTQLLCKNSRPWPRFLFAFPASFYLPLNPPPSNLSGLMASR